MGRSLPMGARGSLAAPPRLGEGLEVGAASLCEGLEERSPVRDGRDLFVATVEERRYAPCARRKSSCPRGEHRCKRFHDAEPLPARLWKHREHRCKRFHDAEPLPARLWKHREHRCKRLHDVEPLPARVSRDAEARSLRREARCKRFHDAEKHREHRCKRFHDVEPLSARLWEHREHRCKRFHDVEPLPARLWKHREARCKRFHDAEPLPARLWEYREARCKRFHDAEPLPARLSQDVAARSLRRETRCKRFDDVKSLPAPRSERFRTLEEDRERLSSRQASRDEQGDDLAPAGDALFRHGANPSSRGRSRSLPRGVGRHALGPELRAGDLLVDPSGLLEHRDDPLHVLLPGEINCRQVGQ